MRREAPYQMMNSDLRELIASGETLTIEFKSDRGPLDDAELLTRRRRN